MLDVPCVETRPRSRWRRRLDDYRRHGWLHRVDRWGWRAAFWFSVHHRFNNIVFGDGYTDWGHRHASVMAVHRWFCRRWVPADERYRASLRPGAN